MNFLLADFYHNIKIITLTLLMLMVVVTNSVLAETTYTVKSGDTLSLIARKFYNNPYKWPYIYRANKEIIKDHDSIQVGWVLKIPNLTKTTQPISSKKLKLVTGNDYAPFADETLMKGGMITDIVRMTFNAMGYSPVIEFWTWSYGYKATKEGLFSATFPYLKNKEREQDFLYSKPLFEILIFPFVRKESRLRYQELSDLKGLTLCRPEGYYIHDIKELIAKNLIKLERPKELETCFNMLVNDKVDVVPVNEFSGKNMIVEMGLSQHIKMLDEKEISIESTLHVIFPKRGRYSRVLQHKFDRSISELEQSGELQEIISQHLENYYQIIESQK